MTGAPSGWQLQDLPWLPPAPPDFAERLRALEADASAGGAALRALAQHALGISQLTRLGKAIARLGSQGRLAPLRPVRLGLIGNGNLEIGAPVLVGAAVRHGIALEVIATPFDQAVQQAVDPDSTLHRARPDFVLVALHAAGLGLGGAPASTETAQAEVARALDRVQTIREGLRTHGRAPVIVQTVPRFPAPLLGSLDFLQPGTARWAAAQLDHGLRALVGEGDTILDVAGLAEAVGLTTWHDERAWALGKQPFNTRLLPLYGDYVGRLLGALRGTSRKVLVLDLDNTCWGGVIGDDGLQGIRIGQGDPVGEAFLQTQRATLMLRERGVVLAVCSKNQDATARLPFREHPEMLLREAHIAVFQANWSDKATNLEAIADTLSLGLDSLVLLDDNPVERAQVRQALPQVAVPELPDDPSLHARTLLWAGYFEAAQFTETDRERAQQYTENARRVVLERSSRNLDEFLQSLEMRAQIAPFDAAGRPRIAQLVARSNQYNLTTRRLTEVEIAEMEGDPSLVTMQVRLADAFGDNGMVSVLVARPAGPALDIDTWLMSCRVLGRRLEQAMLDALVEQAAARGFDRITGTYLPTDRNGIVREHYAGLGFTLVSTEPDGATRWVLDVAAYRPFAPPIRRGEG